MINATIKRTDDIKVLNEILDLTNTKPNSKEEFIINGKFLVSYNKNDSGNMKEYFTCMTIYETVIEFRRTEQGPLKLYPSDIIELSYGSSL